MLVDVLECGSGEQCSIFMFDFFFLTLLWGKRNISNNYCMDWLKIVQTRMFSRSWISVALVILLTYIFCFEWNFSLTFGWIAMKVGSEFHVPLRFNGECPSTSHLICPILWFIWPNTCKMNDWCVQWWLADGSMWTHQINKKASGFIYQTKESDIRYLTHFVQ